MKTFRPTEAEFKKPLAYIENLIRAHNILDFGCIKIIPPESFKPTLAFDMESNQRLPTRYQILQELGQGRAFKQNTNGRTFKEYIDLAKEMGDNNQSHQNNYYKELEREYWEQVDNCKGEQTKVEYAADVPTLKFGSGFARPGQTGLTAKQQEYANHPWNLNNLP
jgi:hypothetical protein